MTNDESNVTLFGHVCIDHNTIEGDSYVSWGSSVLYIADYLRRELVVTPKIIAPYGSDLREVTGQEILNTPTLTNTLVYENIVEHGVRRQNVLHEKASPYVDINGAILDQIHTTDLFIFAPLLATFGAEYVAAVTGALPASALKVLLPQGYFREVQGGGKIVRGSFVDAAKILPLFDLMILSDEDTDNPEDHIAEWLRYNPNLKIIVTQNRTGATVYTNTESISIPTMPLSDEEIINPIGTGDVFSIACAYALKQDGDVVRAIEQAHHAAAASLKSLPAGARTV